MELWVDQQFNEFLLNQGIKNFDDLWTQSMEIVEGGNYRKEASQSEVFRWHHVYVKKQQNYITRLSRWFSPKSVCVREYGNILAWKKLDIPTTEALYCYQEPRAKRAILVTRALDGYQPLDTWLKSTTELPLRAKVFARIAMVLADIHRKGWYHRCFYPKHVFVNLANPEIIKVIDLEKARKQIHTMHRDISEVSAFYRRCPWLNPKEGLQFMKAYFGVNKFETKHRLFLKRLQERIETKEN